MNQTKSTLRIPTHRCKVCGCKWILYPPGAHHAGGSFWSLGTNEQCGKCCDNVAMGDQIETLAEGFDRVCAELDAARSKLEHFKAAGIAP